jgi:ABC-type glycerol-3-phosphate transport system substrate-binding protein
MKRLASTRGVWRVGLICLVLLTSGALCRNSGQQPDTFTLKYWTVYTSSDDIQPVIAAFQAKYPYVLIETKTFRQEEYEDKLIEAWAQGKGPDIFSLPNSHIGAFKKLIAPIPSTLKMTSVTVKESLGRKETVVTPENVKGLSAQEVTKLFPQVVYDDVVKTNDAGSAKIYGLPMSLDTLVLYYNKQLLDAANIALPAATWDDFVKQVPELTLKDVNDNILQSGAALGTSENVPRMFDIVSLLMMQNGATMTEGDSVQFADQKSREDDTQPGVEAVDFYTSFANPAVDWYSWNADQPDGLEAFISGKTAYFLGYYYQLQAIQDRGGQLDFGIAPVPQVTVDSQSATNFANYWVESVSVNSKHQDAAWAFIQALTSNEANVKAILTANPKPTALRSLLDDQKEDFTLAVFANQELSAQSWYAGKDPVEAEQAFTDMIDAINDGRLDSNTAVSNTADKITLTYE